MDIADEIKSRITMADIFSAYGFEPDRGGFIRCPFHDEKTPSLSTYEHGRKWKCFGCGESGDVISFVEKLFRLPFADACKRIDLDFNLGLYREKSFAEARAAKRCLQQQKESQRIENQKRINDFICKKILSKYHCWLWNQSVKTPEMLFDLEYTERMMKSEKLLSINPYALTTALSTKHENGGEWVDILERNKGIW